MLLCLKIKYRYTFNQSPVRLWVDEGNFWISSHCLRPALPSNPHNFLKAPDEEQRRGQEDEADRGIQSDATSHRGRNIQDWMTQAPTPTQMTPSSPRSRLCL